MLSGLKIKALNKAQDARGYFFESFRQEWFSGAPDMVQGNFSFSKTGVLRGLHYHKRQADLWVCPIGHIRVGLFDLRPLSPTYEKSFVLELNSNTPQALYIPKMIAHGFYAIKDSCLMYLVDETYNSEDEFGIAWNDTQLGIDWGTKNPILSDRDKNNPVYESVN